MIRIFFILLMKKELRSRIHYILGLWGSRAPACCSRSCLKTEASSDLQRWWDSRGRNWKWRIMSRSSFDSTSTSAQLAQANSTNTNTSAYSTGGAANNALSSSSTDAAELDVGGVPNRPRNSTCLFMANSTPTSHIVYGMMQCGDRIELLLFWPCFIYFCFFLFLYFWVNPSIMLMEKIFVFYFFFNRRTLLSIRWFFSVKLRVSWKLYVII